MHVAHHLIALQEVNASERAILESHVEGLLRVAQAHSNGKESYARSIAMNLFEDFLLVEELFAANKDATEQEVIDSLRKVRQPLLRHRLDHITNISGVVMYAPVILEGMAECCTKQKTKGWWTPQKSRHCSSTDLQAFLQCVFSMGPKAVMISQEHSTNLGKVVDIVVSHQGSAIKVALVSQLMSALVLPSPEQYRPLLRRFATLGTSALHSKLSQFLDSVICNIFSFRLSGSIHCYFMVP